MSNTRYNTVELPTAVATGIFSAGVTVTIKITDGKTGLDVPIDDTACIPTANEPDIYTWSFSNLTTQPGVFTQLIYVMTDDSAIPVVRREMVDVLGWSDSLPSILPAADMCKVTAFIFEPDDQSNVDTNRLNSDAVQAYAQIQGTYYQSASGKHFDTVRAKPYYESTGLAYWLVPQGATVKFFIKQLEINTSAVIPAQSTIPLNTLLNP